jgi:hypothetical protein
LGFSREAPGCLVGCKPLFGGPSARRDSIVNVVPVLLLASPLPLWYPGLVGQPDQFAKRTFEEESASLTHGVVT